MAAAVGAVGCDVAEVSGAGCTVGVGAVRLIEASPIRWLSSFGNMVILFI